MIERHFAPLGIVAVAAGLFVCTKAYGEPYLAARDKARCSSCHVNMTGGGERNSQGRMYAKATLPRIPFEPSAQFPLLTGQIADFLSVGADLRPVYNVSRPPEDEGKTSNEFAIEEANLYLTARIWRDRLSLHFDEKLAPGGAQNREVFLLYRGLPGGGWFKAGRFFPPYGTRLYDDAAFIRNATGYSFQTPDDGVEFGFEPGNYSLIGAVTNGAGGGSESDNGKQVSVLLSRLLGSYRLGVSGSNNVTGGTRTSLGGILGAAKWGDLVVLAEADIRYDKTAGVSRTQWIGYAEGYWEATRGVTVRLSHEYLDPDRDVATDARTRTGLGVAWFPVTDLEIDARAIYLHGPPQINGQNDWSFHAGAHLFF